mmetsp:Transcript_17957/g.25048  ORF Transcript_17957/g.25048 Transcript_17957/m.25048 type:complete len:166 (+) Transcript_17957:68-565(+)
MAATPVVELKGSKWQVGHQKGNSGIQIQITDNKQSVLIFKSENSVVNISGKVNSITIESCKNVGVIFDAVIATVEVVNSQKTQIQANGAVPSIQLDKSQGATIFLQSAEGKNVELITSSSTEVNVVTPGKTPNDDPIEQAIPHQFVTKFNANGKLETKPVEHVGV